MENKPQKLKNQKSESQFADKKFGDTKGIIVGSIIATIIAMTPYLFYLYESVPNESIWNTFLFTFKSGNFESVQVLFWILTSKFIPLLLLIIWFFTCRHWWYHALLVPIAMYSYQIFMTFKQVNLEFIDSEQLIYLVPIMAIIVPTIYLIRAQIFNKINDATKSLQELEDEFKVSPKSFWDKIKQYF